MAPPAKGGGYKAVTAEHLEVDTIDADDFIPPLTMFSPPMANMCFSSYSGLGCLLGGYEGFTDEKKIS